MTKEIISREALAKTDSGSFRVDEHILARLDWTRVSVINQAMNDLVAANPEFEFMRDDDLIRGGFTIYWRRKRHG